MENKVYIKECAWGELKDNGERKTFYKCKGNVFRIPFKEENKRFNKEFKIKFVEVCERGDALHQMWKRDELEELEKNFAKKQDGEKEECFKHLDEAMEFTEQNKTEVKDGK